MDDGGVIKYKQELPYMVNVVKEMVIDKALVAEKKEKKRNLGIKDLTSNRDTPFHRYYLIIV